MRRALALLAASAAAALLGSWFLLRPVAPSRNPNYPPLPLPTLKLSGPNDWRSALRQLDLPKTPRYMIVSAKNGLGNRLRALASTMSVAASVGRPVLLIWVPDLHCNCSFRALFKEPLPFALLDEEIPPDELLKRSSLRVYNYMRPEPGAMKDENIVIDDDRHTYFKSGFVMNHTVGDWSKGAYHYLQMLKPVDMVERMLVTDRSMVGLHVRNVFDAPRDSASAKRTLGTSAIDGAQKEYGKEGTEQLLKWRQASHWSNFVDRMAFELSRRSVHNAVSPGQPVKFYLAADSEAAYVGLMKRFNHSLVVTRRECASSRCDFRDCTSLVYSLVDMLNLARTRRILGSGYSSYSEVAAWIGAYATPPSTTVRSIRLEMAGRDFGKVLLPTSHARFVDPALEPSDRCPAWEDVLNTPSDSRWTLWSAGYSRRISLCPSGCIVKNCDVAGRKAPCCVNRMRAVWPIDCKLMPYGCPRNPPDMARERYVMDARAVPTLQPSSTCPAREDVLNTYQRERWSLWADATCADGCNFDMCNGGRLAPCCVKRQVATFHISCLLLPVGCAGANSSLSGGLVRDQRADDEIARLEWIAMTEAVPSLMDSKSCPSREDVMNTPGTMRWSLWYDPDCSAGCAVARCNGGRTTPCCVKRMQATWSVPCDGREYGCYRTFSWWSLRGLVVRDRRRSSLSHLGPQLVVLGFALAACCLCALMRRRPGLASDAMRAASSHASLLIRAGRTAHAELTLHRALPSSPAFCVALLLGGFFVYAQTSAQAAPHFARETIQPGQPPIVSEGAAAAERLVARAALAPMSAPRAYATRIENAPEVNERERKATAATLEETFKSPRWFVERESEKVGAGLLFFAYGSTKTLNHFLLEAERAGRSFRDHNPGISIAVVTNNATVNRIIFDKHIMPRMDLLFPGDTENGGQKRGDNLPRQWLTRLYYIAHSPFELTWALDSNVISCTPGAAQVFLQSALLAKLWGYHIAHASQNVLGSDVSSVMYPHNFNIVFQWSVPTSALMREWFLLTLRNGVTSDDQKTLHIAELRLAFRSGLNVGRIAPPFSAAFYNVLGHSNGSVTLRPDRARVTPVLQGPVHVIHTANRSLCAIFNKHASSPLVSFPGERKRQILMRNIHTWDGITPPSFNYDTMLSNDGCVSSLGPDAARYCLLDHPHHWPSPENASRSWVNTEDGHIAVQPNQYVMPVMLEDYRWYAKSKRCGRMCSEYLNGDRLGRFTLKKAHYEQHIEHSMPCAVGSRMQYFQLHEATCERGSLLRGFLFTHFGCRDNDLKGRKMMRFGVRCARNTPDGIASASVERYTGCSWARNAQMHRLASHNMSCPDGFALSSFTFTPDGCEQSGSMHFRYRCSSILIGDYTPTGISVHAQKQAKASAESLFETERKNERLAGGEVFGMVPVRPRFTAATTCTPGGLLNSLDALEAHAVYCPETHALTHLRLVTCGSASEISFHFTCLPVRSATPSPIVAYQTPHVGRPQLTARPRPGDGHPFVQL